MSVKIQDWNRVVSHVTAVAQGPDGKPALLSENRPAWDYRAFTYTGTNVTTITYKQGGSGGTTVLPEPLTYDGNDNVLTQTLTLP